MNICELFKLCDNHQMIDMCDIDSKERIFYGYVINAPHHKKWKIEYVYSLNNTLVIYIKKL